MKVMISQPMNGIPDSDVLKIRNDIIKKAFKMGIVIVDSFDTSKVKDSKHPGVYYLGRTLMKFMHNVDAVYFDDGWFEARGCRIENAVCQEYGIKILTSDFLFEPTQPHIKNCMDTAKVVSIKNNFKNTND